MHSIGIVQRFIQEHNQFPARETVEEEMTDIQESLRHYLFRMRSKQEAYDFLIELMNARRYGGVMKVATISFMANRLRSSHSMDIKDRLLQRIEEKDERGLPWIRALFDDLVANGYITP